MSEKVKVISRTTPGKTRGQVVQNDKELQSRIH